MASLTSASREWLTRHHQAVLITLRSDGSPQSSNVLTAFDGDVFRVSVTAGRAKTRNLARDPRAVVHVLGGDFWAYASVVCSAGLGTVSTEAGDQAGQDLLRLFNDISGEAASEARGVLRRPGRRAAPPAQPERSSRSPARGGWAEARRRGCGEAEGRREHRLEAGELADPVAGETDHEDARAVQAAGDRGRARTRPMRAAGSPGRAPVVDPRRCGAIALKKRCAAAAVVLEGQRRHPDPDVVGHQRDERVDVALGEGRDERSSRRRSSGRAGAGRRRGGCGSGRRRAWRGRA